MFGARMARRAATGAAAALAAATILGGGWPAGPTSTSVAAFDGGPRLAAPAAARAAGIPLRQMDWFAVLASDPMLEYEEAPLFPGSDLRAHVRLVTQGGEVYGYPLVDDIAYGDLDGDGAEEAVIPLFSGGTAGVVGMLLYREGADRPDGRPVLVLARSGYKLGMTIEGGRLVLHEPLYVGFEPNCCPSASTATTYRLAGDRLDALRSVIEPNEEARQVTVYGHYAALSRRDYAAAYEFLSPAIKAAQPFDAWRAGYRDTVDIDVETSDGPAPGLVAVELTATDRTPGGGTVTKRFTGTWSVVWSPDARRWLLDKAQIREVG